MIHLKNISFDHCIKCTLCTIYCPVAKGTHFFPGPKQSGPDAERLRIKNPHLVDASIKYCSNCKRCEISCPSQVKIADLIQSAKSRYFKKRISIRDYILSRMDLLGKSISPFSKIFNPLLKMMPIRYIMEKTAGIARYQNFPDFEERSFRERFYSEVRDQSHFDETVVYFPGCSVTSMDHSLGMDLIKVLNSMGVGISIPETKCCGVPAIANSNIKKAKKNALYNISVLTKAIENSDKRIILTCSSGNLALKHEYAEFLGLDNSKIAEKIDYITTYLYKKFGEAMPGLKPVNFRAAYHSPCHLERMGAVMHTIDILKKIPGLELVILHSECCGMSGTYGFKKEYFEISKNIGAQLFKSIDGADPEYVITDCVTCKWQIENFTAYKVLHPVNVLAMALDR